MSLRAFHLQLVINVGELISINSLLRTGKILQNRNRTVDRETCRVSEKEIFFHEEKEERLSCSNVIVRALYPFPAQLLRLF